MTTTVDANREAVEAAREELWDVHWTVDFASREYPLQTRVLNDAIDAFGAAVRADEAARYAALLEAAEEIAGAFEAATAPGIGLVVTRLRAALNALRSSR